MYDVVVVGAGPAGSEIAYHLAKKKWRVIVLEKQNLDREKSCGGGIQSQEIVEFGDIPSEIIERSISSAKVYASSHEHLYIPQQLKSATVKRAVYDSYLQKRARKQGAEFLEHHEVIDFNYQKDLIVTTVKHQQAIKHIQAKLVIYAAGATTALLKKFKVSTINPSKMYVALEKWFEFEDGIVEERISDSIELYGGSNVVPGGYGWIFPKKNIISIGIGTSKQVITDQKLNLRDTLNTFMYQHPLIKDKISQGKIIRNDGGLIPSEPLEKLHYPSMILIGDAGGFGNIIHGGGIYQARKSATISVEYVDQFLKSNNPYYLAEYEKAVKQHFWEYENKWDNKLVKFFWKDSLLNRTVALANSSKPEIRNAFSIILSSTESHKNAYLIFEQTMLDILYDFLKQQAKPYRELLESKLKSIDFKEPVLAPSINHILYSDSKRFRSTLAFTASQLYYQQLEPVLPIAAAYELLHTASLIHDDIGDHADKRRGQDTVHIKFGVDTAITAGDFLIFEAFKILMENDWEIKMSHKVVLFFSETASKVAQGQALDIHLSRRFSEWTVENYLDMIKLKTGALIEAPLVSGAMVAGASSEQLEILSDIGINLGMAFQIIDDSNDLIGTEETSLKSLFTDIREGKCTLILASLYENCSESEKRTIENNLTTENIADEQIINLLNLCRKYDAISFSQTLCGILVKTISEKIYLLPDTPARQKLYDINDMIYDWCSLGG